MLLLPKEMHELQDSYNMLESWNRISEKDRSGENWETLYKRTQRKYLWEMMRASRKYYDEEIERNYFESKFEENMKSGMTWVPEWIRESVSAEVLALECLPREDYKRVRRESKKLEKKMEQLRKEANALLLSEDLPINMKTALEDCHNIYYVMEAGSDLFVLIEGLTILHFRNALVLEDELPLGKLDGSCTVEQELYKDLNGLYELHWLCSGYTTNNEDRYFNLTFRFETVDLVNVDETWEASKAETEDGRFQYGLAEYNGFYIPLIREKLFADKNGGYWHDWSVSDDDGTMIFQDKKQAELQMSEELETLYEELPISR